MPCFLCLAEGVFIRTVSLNPHDGGITGSYMHEAMVHGFLVRIQPGSHLGGGFRGGSQSPPYPAQQGQEETRRFFAASTPGWW